MGIFSQLCRTTGLMLHYLVKPVDKPQRQVLSKHVEEKQVDDTTTLRRTTIEEIEIKREPLK